jgi:hypothetical protein
VICPWAFQFCSAARGFVRMSSGPANIWHLRLITKVQDWNALVIVPLDTIMRLNARAPCTHDKGASKAPLPDGP